MSLCRQVSKLSFNGSCHPIKLSVALTHSEIVETLDTVWQYLSYFLQQFSSKAITPCVFANGYN